MWGTIYIWKHIRNIKKKRRRFYNDNEDDKQMKNFAPTLTMADGDNNNVQRKKSILKRVSWSLEEPTHDRENIQHDEMVSETNHFKLFFFGLL